jgi:hypothetical protein
MTDSQLTLDASLQPLVRRARAEVVARWLLMSAAVATVWACAVLAAGRIWTLPVVALIATGGVVLLTTGAVMSVVRRPSPLIAARTADRRLVLAERLATAVSLSAGTTEIGERQRRDASSVAKALRVGDVYPLRSLRWRALAVAVGLAAAVALAITTPSNARAAQRAASDHAAIQKAIAAISKQEQATHRAATAQPDPTGALHQLDQTLRDALAQLHKAQTPEQALETISQLGQQIQNLADPTLPSRLGAASAAGSAMTGPATLGQVAAALAQGNLSSAAASLRSVAGSLAQLTPAQLHQLASALARAASASTGDRPLANALQQAASARSGVKRAAVGGCERVGRCRSRGCSGRRCFGQDRCRRGCGRRCGRQWPERVARDVVRRKPGIDLAKGQREWEWHGHGQRHGHGHGHRQRQRHGQRIRLRRQRRDRWPRKFGLGRIARRRGGGE